MPTLTATSPAQDQARTAETDALTVSVHPLGSPVLDLCPVLDMSPVLDLSPVDLNATALNACASMPGNAYAYGNAEILASVSGAPEGICVPTMKRTWTTRTVFGTHRQRPKESSL